MMILITGGVKSGKSRFALKLAKGFKKKAFIATGVPFDEEMKRRIEKHKAERGRGFGEYEEPVNLGTLLRKISSKYDVIRIDCMTTWLGNLFHYKVDLEEKVSEFIESLSGKEIIITNEVGFGIIPSDKTTREYAEELGKLNSRLASLADEVYLMVCGIEVKIK